jgi:integrase
MCARMRERASVAAVEILADLVQRSRVVGLTVSGVFPTSTGNVQHHSNLAARGFAPLQRALGLVDERNRPRYGLHSLRHFFASWAIEMGFPPKRLQALLGHSSIAMTFDTYGHLFPNLADDHAKFAAGEAGITAARVVEAAE